MQLCPLSLLRRVYFSPGWVAAASAEAQLQHIYYHVSSSSSGFGGGLRYCQYCVDTKGHLITWVVF